MSLWKKLKNHSVEWPNRIFVRHVGRWPKGTSPEANKYAQVSIRDSRWQMVWNNKENAKKRALYDLKNDPGETTDVSTSHPEVAARLDREYDRGWKKVQPLLVNESAVPPEVNPYHELYWKQYKGPGPNKVLPPK